MSLSTQLGNSACRLYHQEQVVCPPKMRDRAFTTSAIDNIDHNPSSTTAKQAFHGTAISLMQHPAFPEAGIDRIIIISLGRTKEISKQLIVCLTTVYACPIRYRQHQKHSRAGYQRAAAAASSNMLKKIISGYNTPKSPYKKLLHCSTFHGLHTTPASRTCQPVGPSVPPHCFHSSWRMPTPWL